MEERFAMKHDLQNMEARTERKFVTKSDFSKVSEDLIDLIKAFREEIMSEIGLIRKELVIFKDIDENHEQRITNLEDKVYS